MAFENLEAFREPVARVVLRNGGLDLERKAAGAAGAHEPLGADVFSKRSDREHHENSGRDEADDGEIARAAGFEVERAEIRGVEGCVAVGGRGSREPRAAQREAGCEEGEAGEIECALWRQATAREGEGGRADHSGGGGDHERATTDFFGSDRGFGVRGKPDRERGARLATHGQPDRAERTGDKDDDADGDTRGLRGEGERRGAAVAGPNGFEETKNAAGVEGGERQAQRCANDEDDGALGETPAQELARGEADGAEERVLAIALEEAELKQHRDEAERGEDQEKTHAEEKAAEIDGGLRAGLRAGADVADKELIHLGLQRGEESAFKFGGLSLRERNAQGGERAPTRGPHFASGGEGEKRFGCAAEFVPIFFIVGPDEFQVERQTGVPIALVLGVTDAGEVGHPRTVGRKSGERNDGANAKRLLLFDEGVGGANLKIGDADFVVFFGVKIVGEPAVEHDLARAEVGGEKRRGGGGSGRGDGIGRGAITDAQFVDEVSGGGLDRRKCAGDGFGDRGIEEDALGAEFEGGWFFEPLQGESVVGEAEDAAEGFSENRFRFCAIEEDKVGPTWTLEGLLEQLDREENGGARDLGGGEIEAAEGVVADDGGDFAANGFQFRFGAGDGGVAGEDAGFLQANDEGIADRDLEAAGERVVDGDF